MIKIKNIILLILFTFNGETTYSQTNNSEIKIWLDDSISMEFVKIDSLDIWAGKYEVTNLQYSKFMRYRDGYHINGLPLDGLHQPAVFVSYCDVQGFLYWINANIELPEGLKARLPSGSEWSYLIDRNRNLKYPWGNDWPPSMGNYLDQTGNDSLRWDWHIKSYRDNFEVSAPVHLTSKNDFGIYGLPDNVREWTSEEAPKDGWYFIRGASWRDSKREVLETKYKISGAQWGKDNHIGFRVVLSDR